MLLQTYLRNKFLLIFEKGKLSCNIRKFFTIFCLFLYSDYNRSITNVNVYGGSAVAGDGVIRAVWQLVLAFLFKGIITVFTFGLKVRNIITYFILFFFFFKVIKLLKDSLRTFFL